LSRVTGRPSRPTGSPVIGGAPVTRYDDVALEALIVQDERLAREFVAR
jgi:hypothetical protein